MLIEERCVRPNVATLRFDAVEDSSASANKGATLKKILSLYQRNYDGDRLVRDEVVPGAEWVLAGEGVATQKYDGTACMVRDSKLFRRYDRKRDKRGQMKSLPPRWEPCEPEANEHTGHWPGWLPVGEGPDDRWHRDAFNTELEIYRAVNDGIMRDGTYELCGPKVQGNPEGVREHRLLKHGIEIYPTPPRSFKALAGWLAGENLEGIVWHHPDGRMVKIKKRDFGLKRGF